MTTTRDQRSRVNSFDVFVGVNAALLVVTTLYAYATTRVEFGLYAVVILAAGVAAWWYLRRFEYPLWLLGLLQVGIIAHFAGGLFYPGNGDVSLYNHHFFGIRYDKFVHFYNSMVVAMLLSHIARASGAALGALEPFVIVLATLGLGAVIEIVEYFAVLTIPYTTVGDYANNVEDLVMNLLGGVVGVTLMAVGRRVSANRQAAA